MKTIHEKELEIIEDFAIYEDWMDKYEYIIDLGKDTPKIDEKFKTNDHLILGCQSKVWVNASMENGRIRFTADSDAIITRGIIGLLIRVLDNEKPEDIATAKLEFIATIGLKEHLSPNRSNGLENMVKQLKRYAILNVAH
jgi:cysteine desulfuration protein SufE